jgi:serine/threonine protein kinase
MNETLRDKFFVGDYELTDFIGKGGMGEVYKGMHTRLRREAAIKQLRLTGADQLKSIQRFFNEARIQASFHHPNIVTLYDFIEERGQLYIVMEYVDGETLERRMERAGRLPAPEAVVFFRSVVAAIRHLHSHGVIHRDIKPNNIKINSRGEVKLLDFGIARNMESTKLTTEGKLAGTLPYLAPEQIETGASDERTDIWELGVLLYEMVCGNTPFRGASFEELCVRIVRGQYPPPSSVTSGAPRPVEEIIARCLKKDPGQRYQSAEHLLHALDKLSGGGARRKSATREVVVRIVNKIQNIVVTPSPSSPSGPPLKTVTVSPGMVAMAVALLGLLVIIGGYFLFTSSHLDIAEGKVRTALSCDASGAKVFKLISHGDTNEEWELVGTCGEDSLRVDGRPGDLITLKREKTGRVVRPDPFEVSDRRREFHIQARPEEFE